MDHQHHHVLRRGGAGGAQAQRPTGSHGDAECGQHQAGGGQGAGADAGDQLGGPDSWLGAGSGSGSGGGEWEWEWEWGGE